jgi:ribosomal protein L37AE/L43A
VFIIKQLLLSPINNISMVHSKGTTDFIVRKNRKICPHVLKEYLLCEDCGSSFYLNKGCGRHDCEPCQYNKKGELYEKYSPLTLIRNWDEKYVYFLTITNKNTMDLDPYNRPIKRKIIQGEDQEMTKRSSRYIDDRDKLFKRLMLFMKKNDYIAKEGFYSKECLFHEVGEHKLDHETGEIISTYTESDAGYHYHYHILMVSEKEHDIYDFKNDVEKEWLRLTGDSYIVDVQKMNNSQHGLNYLLKYVCKTEKMTKGLQLYYDLTQGKRYFQTFGLKYGKGSKKEKIDIKCPECGGELVKNPYRRNSPFFQQLPQGYENPVEFNWKQMREVIEMKEDKKGEIKTKLMGFLMTKEEQLLARVRPYKDFKNNADMFYNVLDDKDIEYLTQRGSIYKIDQHNFAVT